MNKKNELREKIAEIIKSTMLYNVTDRILTPDEFETVKIKADKILTIIQPELDAKDELISAYESVKAPHACVPNLCGQLKVKDAEIERLRSIKRTVNRTCDRCGKETNDNTLCHVCNCHFSDNSMERIKELEGMTEGYSNWVTEVIEGHPELFDID